MEGSFGVSDTEFYLMIGDNLSGLHKRGYRYAVRESGRIIAVYTEGFLASEEAYSELMEGRTIERIFPVVYPHD